MDAHAGNEWLAQLDLNTAVLLPTRGLVSHFNEQYAAAQIATDQSVWEPPQLLVWADYLGLLWQKNKAQLAQQKGVFNLISPQQSLLLWTQVIEKSRRNEQSLILLNVQQTVVAVQRSWRLLHEWQVDSESLAQDHVADTEQLLRWIDDYRALLAKRGLVDQAWLQSMLLELDGLVFPFSKLAWREYDLITAVQTRLNQRASELGVDVDVQRKSSISADQPMFRAYSDTSDEIRQTLTNARTLLEQDSSQRISIIIPDLSQRLPQVRELAREIFYPASSPLQVQQNNSVYRFSLGEPLSDWAAVETALCVIKLLQNRVSVIDLSFLLRNQFLKLGVSNAMAAQTFDRWLKRRRLHTLSVDKLASLYVECMTDNERSVTNDDPFYQGLQQLVEQREQLKARLVDANEQQDFAALPFDEWVGVFSDWLRTWGWHTTAAEEKLNTVQHQLHERWQRLLMEYTGLSLVQRRAGLKRAFDVLQQMARDATFLPKSVNSPILISSLLEAIGRPVDVCYLTGMNDAFPPPPRNDAFVPSRLLLNTGNPNASAQASFEQAERVNQSVLSQSTQQIISYALVSDTNRESLSRPSPLFRHATFSEIPPLVAAIEQTALQTYKDSYGPVWDEPGLARGGSKIFEHQSNCAFKAFVNHQLGFDQEDEVEFGLDQMDRGNVVHYLLDDLWGELDNQASLLQKSADDLAQIIERVIDQGFEQFRHKLSDDKFLLLQLERPRLRRLLSGWLQFEARRPQNFTVLERETENFTEFAGIKFKLIIDRLDVIDDGRTFVIDYKTGAAERKDWLGERMAKPQLPLYAVALDAQKRKQVSGIAIAKVDAVQPKFVELAEAGVFSKTSRKEQDWLDNRPHWENTFTELAQQFLAGFAEVNPIDDKTCEFCNLHAVCRISQLQSQTDTPSISEVER